MKADDYDFGTSIGDLTMLMAFCFFIMFMLTLVLINPVTKKTGDVELKAEIMVTVEWPNNSTADVDTLFRTPSKEIVFFRHPNGKFVSLDRDDRGIVSDAIKLKDGTSQYIYENWEHVFVRKKAPGRYDVSVYLFRQNGDTQTPVTVKVVQLNPYQIIYSTTVVLTYEREEQSIVQFEIDGGGNVVSIDNDVVLLGPEIDEALPHD